MKLTRFTKTLPARINKPCCKWDTDHSNCPEEAINSHGARMRFSPNSPGEKTLQHVPHSTGCLRVWGLLQAPSFCELPLVLVWSLVMQMSLCHFWSFKYPPICTSVNNYNKTHLVWFTKLRLVVSALWSVLDPLSGVLRHVFCIFPGKVMS